MKIRIYCPYYPFPITEGAFQIMFDQVRVLSRFHEVELVTWMDSRAELDRKIANGDPFNGFVKHIFWGDLVGNRESRKRRIIRTLKSVFLFAPSPAEFYYASRYDQRADLDYADLGIYHYTYSWNWLRRNRKSEDTVSVHFHNVESDLYSLRASKEKSLLAKALHSLNAAKLRFIERTLNRLVDETWYVSRKDAIDFQRRFDHSPSIQSIFGPSYSHEFRDSRESTYLKHRTESENSAPVLGFVGTLDFDPNILSLEWILDRLAPLLAERNWSGKILVVGRNPDPRIVEKMNKYKFLEYKGYVENIEDFWASLSAFLIPHVDGSGVRVKLLDALASGIPTIANSKAVERIDELVSENRLLRISDDENEWIEIIDSLRGFTARSEEVGRSIDQQLLGEHIYRKFCE